MVARALIVFRVFWVDAKTLLEFFSLFCCLTNYDI